MYALLGISILLAALLTLNALATVLATAVWRALSERARRWPARARAQVIFALRLFPMLCASVSVLALVTPSYIAHEPATTTETVSFKLFGLALVSAVGLVLALWRGFASWRATRLLVKDWLQGAEPLKLEGVHLPAYRIHHPFPVIAVVGAFRPRLFIATQIFDALSDEELVAAIAHEQGHLATRDNLKRTALRVCRDALAIVPCGRSLDRAWAEAAEEAADEYAAHGDAASALDLASALVKIARIIPPRVKPTMPAIAFLIGEESGGIVWRVRRLTQLASAGRLVAAESSRLAPVSLWLSLSAFILALLLLATNSNALWAMHGAIERVVWLLG